MTTITPVSGGFKIGSLSEPELSADGAVPVAAVTMMGGQRVTPGAELNPHGFRQLDRQANPLLIDMYNSQGELYDPA